MAGFTPNDLIISHLRQHMGHARRIIFPAYRLLRPRAQMFGHVGRALIRRSWQCGLLVLLLQLLPEPFAVQKLAGRWSVFCITTGVVFKVSAVMGKTSSGHEMGY
jgi:hypothetical protein